MITQEEPRKPKGWRETLVRTPMGVCLSLVVAAVGAWLLLYHANHVVAAIPYLILLGCPLMHVFMHGGHKHRDGGEH